MRKLLDRRALYSLAIGSLLTIACGRPDATQDSEVQAIVSQTQADQAFRLVYKIDYLPFNYIEDGCYARELFMAMELAGRKIPSSAHYIYGDLHPNDDTNWSYHVAPLLKVGEEEAWVLDPSFERAPLRLNQWIKKNFPAGRYTTQIKAGSAYFDEKGRTSEFNKARLVKSFKEFPTFLTSDIAAACGVMYSYIAKEAEDVEYKRTKLLNRTAELVNDLNALNKVEAKTLSRQVNARCRQAIETGLDLDSSLVN